MMIELAEGETVPVVDEDGHELGLLHADGRVLDAAGRETGRLNEEGNVVLHDMETTVRWAVWVRWRAWVVGGGGWRGVRAWHVWAAVVLGGAMGAVSRVDCFGGHGNHHKDALHGTMRTPWWPQCAGSFPQKACHVCHALLPQHPMPCPVRNPSPPPFPRLQRTQPQRSP